jgi:hypothetical protein
MLVTPTGRTNVQCATASSVSVTRGAPIVCPRDSGNHNQRGDDQECERADRAVSCADRKHGRCRREREARCAPVVGNGDRGRRGGDCHATEDLAKRQT